MKSPATEKFPSEIWSAARTIIKLQRQAPPIKPVPRDSNLPLSFAQARLWFLHQLQPDSLSYQSLRAYRLTGSLNVTALELSLNQIQQRHEALRTNFPTVEGHPVQLIAPTATLKLPIIDLRKLPETEREAEAQRQAIQEAQQPFDLAKGPLWRVKLLHLTTEEHVLLLSMHHIVYDGWSLGVLFRELAALYQAFSTNQSSLGHATLTPLPELPIQYADFAVWQRQWLSGEVLESQLNYWKQQLSGNLPVLQLPTDYPRPPVQTYRGTSQSLVLPLDLTAALKSLSQQSGVTLFMTLLAAFQTLLYRYTEQEDIIVGSPIANRNRREIEGLIGFFANTLVLRTDLSGNPTFRELLRRVSQVTSGAYGHQDLPFEKLVEELQPERDLSRTPLFQVMFVLLNTPTSPLELPGLAINSLNVPSGTTKFDLTLYVEDTAQGLRGSLSYNTDLFDTATISRMLGHFQTLLEGIVANPEQRLEDLPLLTAAEQHQLLVEWNDTRADYPKDACIHQLFEAQVERTPDAVAMVFEREQLTYRELNCRANQLARYLRSLGVEPEVLVGICVERSLEMVVGLLGILKTGGAYVPLDPAYPQERLAFMLEDAQVPVLLTQQPLVGNLPDCGARLVCLDTDWKAIARENQENLTGCVTDHSLAYVIYTSGSTGNPKGVLGFHQGAINRFNWMWKTFPFEAGETCCQKTSLSFVDSVWEIFGPLLQGIPTVIIPDAALKDLYRLVQILAIKDVTRIVLVPSLLRVLLNTYPALESRLPKLKYWVTSGEALDLELSQCFQKLMPESILLNLYGSSEVSADATWYDTRKSKSLSCVPIGCPIANTQVYVLNRHLKPVPIGVRGELYIGGASLARGYLNRPELTEEKFIPNPFSDEPGAYLYKTGDLARYLSDGNIEFLSRIDHQVKVRGFRIELGEIEAVLAQHQNVRETVVTAREDIRGDKRLVAYVVLNQEQATTTSELRHLIKQKLPDYMVPSVFMMLNALPLTPNGKVDRRALPVPDQARQEPEETFIAPRDKLELQLTKIWEEVLGKKSISVRENFFDLGGHSLLAVRLVAEIEKTFNKKLPLATLFQALTIEELAIIVRQSGWSATWSSLVEIQTGGTKRPFFFVHEAEGHILCYREVASYLGSEQPVYGLQPKRLEGKYALHLHTQVEDMAAHYIQEIRTIQPKGPYLIGGLCAGGVVAFEMAQQLHAQGQEVDLLVLLDSFIGSCSSPIPDKVNQHLSIFSQLRPKQKLTYILQKAHKKVEAIINRIKHRLKFISYKFYIKNRWVWLPVPLNTTFRDTFNTRQYVPQVYSGRVTLFRATEGFIKAHPDSLLGWGKLAAGGLEIHDIPGNHNDKCTDILVAPNVQVLAEKLRSCIERTQEDNSGVHLQ